MERASIRLAAVKIAGCCATLSLIATTPPAGDRVHFATCTLPGVERGCIVATSGTTVYNVTGVKPGIAAHQWLQGTGTVTDMASFCMQGPVIKDFQPDAQQAMVGCVPLKRLPVRR